MSFKSIAIKLLTLKPPMYVNSIVLNALGMQSFRTFYFYLRRILRIPKSISATYLEYLKILKRDGIVIIPDFFPDDVYAQIQDEYEKLSPEFIRDDSEIPIPHVNRLSIHDKKVSDQFREYFLKDPLIQTLPRAFLNRNYNLPITAHLVRIFCNKEEITLPSYGGTNNLHFDAPLRVLKAFYYVTDTNERNAALQYCAGSPKRNSLKRLFFEYKLSVRYMLNRWNPNHHGEYVDNEPWVKITDDEMQKQGLQEKVVSVKGNTMVFVDTGGFHRRGIFTEAGVRKTVEFNYRSAESFRNDLYPLERKIRALV